MSPLTVYRLPMRRLVTCCYLMLVCCLVCWRFGDASFSLGVASFNVHHFDAARYDANPEIYAGVSEVVIRQHLTRAFDCVLCVNRRGHLQSDTLLAPKQAETYYCYCGLAPLQLYNQTCNHWATCPINGLDLRDYTSAKCRSGQGIAHLYHSVTNKVAVWSKRSKNEFGILVSSDTPTERALIGSLSVKICGADSGQPLQSYGRKCEHAKLCTVWATCRIIEKQESEQNKVLSCTVKTTVPALVQLFKQKSQAKWSLRT